MIIVQECVFHFLTVNTHKDTYIHLHTHTNPTLTPSDPHFKTTTTHVLQNDSR